MARLARAALIRTAPPVAGGARSIEGATGYHGAMADPPARVIAELYAVPPSAFTRERNARAAALAKARHPDEARAVKQLRRPSASLWATNQLARAEPTRLAAFLEAVDRLRATQLRTPRAAAETAREHREHLNALVQRAGEVLHREGYRLTPALTRRISDTLFGAAADRRLADDLRHGRLAAEVAAPGFDALVGIPGAGRLHIVTGGNTAPRAVKVGKPAVAPAPAATNQVREAEERRRIEALEHEAATRKASVAKLEGEITAAATALAEQRRRLSTARREAKRAASTARKTRKTAR